MPEPQLEVLIHQVEIALEEGDLDTADRLLSTAPAHWSSSPELGALTRRIQEVRHLSRRPTIDSLVKQSQDRIRAADYQGALIPLRTALSMAPGDQALQGLLSQTEKAASRHAVAVERQNTVTAAGREIEALLAAGNPTEARNRLSQTKAQLGRHPLFEDLEKKLAAAQEKARREHAQAHVDRAVKLRGQQDWPGMLNQAELALTLEPDLADAVRLKAEAEHALKQQEQQRHLWDSVQAGAQDVSRLIEAGEVLRAEQRLQQLRQQLGDHQSFDDLAAGLDQAKKSKDVERRSEWAERRSREAESLLQQAVRSALGGRFEEALDKLDAAQQMDPDLENLEERRRDYRSALEHQQAVERRQRAVDATHKNIRSSLDGLRLDEASQLLRQARQKFAEPGDLQRWQQLEQRLQGLRLEDEAAQELPRPETLSRLGMAARTAVQKRQETLAGAYSWKQAFLYPARNPLVLGLCIALSALVSLLAISLPVLVLLLPFLGFLLVPIFIQATLDAENSPPAPSQWTRHMPWQRALQWLLAVPWLTAPALAATLLLGLGILPSALG